MIKVDRLLIGLFIASFLLLAGCSRNIDSMTDAEKEAAIQDAMEKDPPKFMNDEQMGEEARMADFLNDGRIIKSGSFQGKAHPTTGSISIIEKNGENYVVLSDDFKSDAGPELHLFVEEHSNPGNSKDIHSGEYVDLGLLKSTSGAQTYKIDKEKIGKINSATVYCKPFRVIFGLATIS